MGRVVLGRVCRGVWGVSGGGLWGEKVSLAPLYYPDTLVNLDTCCFRVLLNFFVF